MNTADNKNYLNLQILWLAMAAAIVIYVGVAYFFLGNVQFAVPGQVGILFPLLILISAAVLAAQIVLRIFLSDDRMFPRILQELLTFPTEGPILPDLEGQILLRQHVSFHIVIWALGEAPAIFGLVLTFLSGDIHYVAGFALYSIFNMFLFRPHHGDFKDQLVRLKRYLAAKG